VGSKATFLPKCTCVTFNLLSQFIMKVVFYNVVLIYHQHNYVLILLSDHQIIWKKVLTKTVIFRPLHNIKINDNFMLISCAVTLRPQSCNYYIIQFACQYKILKLLKYVTAQYNNKNTFNVEDF
jgi:hypothetical protein